MSNEPVISQDETSALLGRPLSEIELNNFDLYLQIAISRLDDLLCIKLESMAELPADLKLLIARCFATITQEQSDSASHGISSKKVEDFSISFEADASSPMTAFVQQNSSDLNKYAMCQGPIRSGISCMPFGGGCDCL